MASIVDIIVEALRLSRPKIDSNFKSINNQLESHIVGASDKHSADKINYSGLFLNKSDVASALDQAKSEINTIVVNASIDPEVALARTSSVKDKTFETLDLRIEDSEQDFKNHLADSASVKRFGAIGDGVTDDTVAIQAAENSNFKYIDLVGLSVKTTLSATALSKNYYNGSILVKASSGNGINKKPLSPLKNIEIQNRSTKSPIINWSGKNVLWLGTSIPHQGGSIDSYSIIFGKALGCNVDNMAWSASHAYFDPSIVPATTPSISALSMTEDDRIALLTQYGESSAYSDTFDTVTKASEMTCDYRIKRLFKVKSYDCIVLDHNHNDSGQEMGTINPTKLPISNITKGLTTTLTVPSHNYQVGDAVALEIEGISFLNHAAARVVTVSGDNITLNIDSSSYTGTLTSGNTIKLDRKTFYGAYEFLIHYIMNCRIIYGNINCSIVLCSAPNNYSAFQTTPDYYFNVSVLLKNLSDKWSLPFFDVGYEYNINKNQVLTYFSDGWHPMDAVQRQALANHWIKWARGGAEKSFTALDFQSIFPVSNIKTFKNQREAIYTSFYGGFGTPDFLVGNAVSIYTDDFLDGDYTNWTAGGATPTVVNAPWDNSQKAVKFDSTATQSAYLTRMTAFQAGREVIFDLYVPETENLIESGVGQIKLADIGYLGVEPHTVLQLIVTKNNASLRTQSISDTVQLLNSKNYPILKNTKYTIKIQTIKATANYSSVTVFYVNDILVDIVNNFIDANKSMADRLSIGLMDSTTNKDLTAYYGNVIVNTLPLNDFTQRYTGTLTVGTSTVNIVNGIITNVS